MKPVRTPRTQNTYRGHPSAHVGDLPCRIEDGVVYSVWELEPEERIAIAEGARIELAVFMGEYAILGGLPPVSLAIDSEAIELEKEKR